MFHTALQGLGTPLEGYTFVDLGCGKGKLLLLGGSHPFARIIGVEFAPALLPRRSATSSVFVISTLRPRRSRRCWAARHWTLPAGPVVALIFNAFDPNTTREVMLGIDREAAREAPLFVLYVNLRRVAEARHFTGLTRLERVQASRRLLVFANDAAQAVYKRRGPFR